MRRRRTRTPSCMAAPSAGLGGRVASERWGPEGENGHQEDREAGDRESHVVARHPDRQKGGGSNDDRGDDRRADVGDEADILVVDRSERRRFRNKIQAADRHHGAAKPSNLVSPVRPRRDGILRHALDPIPHAVYGAVYVTALSARGRANPKCGLTFDALSRRHRVARFSYHDAKMLLRKVNARLRTGLKPREPPEDYSMCNTHASAVRSHATRRRKFLGGSHGYLGRSRELGIASALPGTHCREPV